MVALPPPLPSPAAAIPRAVNKIILFLIFIRIRRIGTGSHPYEKTMSSINYIQLSTNIKMYNHKIKTIFLVGAFGTSGQKKLVLIL